MKTGSGRVIIQALLVILTVQFCFSSKYLFAGGSKDVILVLDTSLSMLGYGGKNILDRVKKSIERYIDNQIEHGDRVTFITFDTEVKVFPTVLIDDENDRDILKKYISMIEATGKWTHTYKMMMKVFERAKKLELEDDERQTLIVVMTDALDDPPPYSREKFNIKDITSKYGKKDWWIYWVSFSDLKKNRDVREKFTRELSKISDKVKIIDGDDPEKAIGKDLPEDVKRLESESSSIVIPIIIAGLVILLVIIVLFVFKRYSELKVSGKLEYWNNEIIEPYIEKFDLARRPVREALIGKGIGCILNIRDINIKSPFSIKAVRSGKEVRMQLSGGEGTNVEMVNRDSIGILEDGDIFKVGNYTFKYIVS